MKKMRLVIVSIICLVATLVVSSFAWFAIGNNGFLSTKVKTNNQIVIDFDASGTDPEAAMKPAKLKEGVINDASGSILGKEDKVIEKVPSGRDVLPLHDSNYKYVTSDGKTLQAKNRYLYTPATLVYNQFSILFATNDTEVETKDLKLEFGVYYYSVDQILNGEDKTPISQLYKFDQTEALAFNFFLVEDGGSLTEEELVLLSTNTPLRGQTPRMIEDYYFNQDREEDSKFTFKEHGNDIEDGTNLSTYRYPARQIGDSDSYTVVFEDLKVNQRYYLVLETYYCVPDAVIRGNLPLTGQFVLNVSYKEVTPTN